VTSHLCVILIASVSLSIAAETPRTSVPDSLRKAAGIDSTGLAPKNTPPLADTSGRISTPSLVGTLDRNLDSGSVRTRENMHWLDYRYLGDILESFPGTFIRNQYSEGAYNQLTLNGSDWRAIAVTINGRLLNDPLSGIFNLYHFTTEYADRIEVVTGPRAFLYGLNSTGGTVNLVTKNYNSNKPFTKLDYSEGAYGYSYVDGTFSQNVSRRVNLTLGFQHQATDGRYTNGLDEAWNARSKIRYNVSPDLNVIFSYYYTATQTGLNGGIDLTGSGLVGAFDPTGQAAVTNPDSYEKLSRNDVDLSFVGTFLPDTTNVSSLSLYYADNFRQYRDEENRSSPNGILIHSDHTASWMGATLSQNYDTGFQSFQAGANVELRQIEGSPNLGRRRNLIGAVWAKEDLRPADRLTVAGFARYDRYLGTDYLGVGADATLRVSDRISFDGGLSTSERVPNYQELFWTDSTVARTGTIAAEHHQLIEVGGTINFPGSGSLHIGYVHRTVTSPILFTPGPAVNSPFASITIGNGSPLVSHALNARVALRFWYLSVEGSALYLLRSSGGAALDYDPKLSGNGGIYFWHTLLNNKLEIKTGVEGRFALAHTGLVYNPEVIAYVPGTGPRIGANSSIDFFMIAHIGDAYVHFMWENLTDIQYYGTPFYPGGERALRFGISWEFLD